MTWKPATKELVELVLQKERQGNTAENLALIEQYCVDPHLAVLERFGADENAFVVARSSTHVVYFDDIEEDFGTAREVDGRLVDCAMYGPLTLAVRVLHYELPHT